MSWQINQVIWKRSAIHVTQKPIGSIENRIRFNKFCVLRELKALDEKTFELIGI